MLLLYALVFAVLLSGCQTGYHSRDEVISTLQEAFPNDGIVVSQKFETGTTEQGVPIETNGRTFGYISFGGLYGLLESLECSPQGDASHFKVLGTDGIWYEFSYSFYYEENGKEMKQAYYYLCDGDEVPLWETMLSLQDDRDLLVDVTGLIFTLI